MITWLKLVAAIVAAEAIEHTVEALFVRAKVLYARRNRR